MKMKVYSIGREEGCDIVINDNSDATSRRHATLTVMPSGKMTITDQSRNGTYVNGIKISPNVAVPVTRKDNISFAHVYRLDWNQIPKPVSMMQYVIYGLIVLAVIVGGIIAYSLLSGGSDTNIIDRDNPQVDSCMTCKKPASECPFKGNHPIEVDSCKTCKKPVSECPFKGGKHPTPPTEQKCKTCKKAIKQCPYGGNHPKTCPTCKKPISECPYGGNHSKTCPTCKKPISECPYGGKHRSPGR